MIRLALGHLWYYFPRVSLTFLLKLIGTLGNFKECNEWERHPVMIRPLFGHLWFHPVANHVFNGVPHSCRCGIVFCHSFHYSFSCYRDGNWRTAIPGRTGMARPNFLIIIISATWIRFENSLKCIRVHPNILNWYDVSIFYRFFKMHLVMLYLFYL